jgi:hypothetical protein
MRLAQFISNKNLIKSARQLHDNNETFRQMVVVLENESPLAQPLAPQGVSADDRSHRLGLIEGYNLALTNLRRLWSKPPAAPTPLVATFEKPDE